MLVRCGRMFVLEPQQSRHDLLIVENSCFFLLLYHKPLEKSEFADARHFFDPPPAHYVHLRSLDCLHKITRYCALQSRGASCALARGASCPLLTLGLPALCGPTDGYCCISIIMMSSWEQDTRQELLNRLEELNWDLSWIQQETLLHRVDLRSKFARRASGDELTRVSTIQSLCVGAEYAPAAVSVRLNLPAEPSPAPHSQKHTKFIQNPKFESYSLHIDENQIVSSIFQDPERVYVDDGVQIGSLAASSILRYFSLILAAVLDIATYMGTFATAIFELGSFRFRINSNPSLSTYVDRVEW
jgi:hypothetical protein